MKQVRPILFLILITSSIPGITQSPEIQARAAFLTAQEAYGNGDYISAIDKLNEVKNLLKTSNPRVESLLAQSYMANNQPDLAEDSMKAYFELASDSDPSYNAMLMMIEEIKRGKEEAARLAEEERKKQLLLEKEPIIWKETISTNTQDAYESYIKMFPSGTYVNEARSALLNYPPRPLIDTRDNSRYETVRLGGLIWMQSNLNYSSPDSRCYDDDSENCIQHGRIYGYEEAKKVCPEGWRLPRYDELQSILTSMAEKEFSKKNPNVINVNFADGTYGEFGKQLNLFPAGTFVLKNPPGIKADMYKSMGTYAVMWTEDGRLILSFIGKKGWIQLSNTDKIPEFRLTDLKLFGYCRCVKDENANQQISDEAKSKAKEKMNEIMGETIKKALNGKN